MKTYYGGESVKGGFYFGFHQKDIIDVNENEKLPGGKESKYWRIPLIFMLIGGPLLGLFYVMFLPFISFALVFGLLFKKVRTTGSRMVRSATVALGQIYRIRPRRMIPKRKQLESTQKSATSPQKAPLDIVAKLENEIVERRKEGIQ